VGELQSGVGGANWAAIADNERVNKGSSRDS